MQDNVHAARTDTQTKTLCSLALSCVWYRYVYDFVPIVHGSSSCAENDATYIVSHRIHVYASSVSSAAAATTVTV